MWGWLFGSSRRQSRPRRWGDTNPLRDIGQAYGKGPRKRGGGGGRRQARPNRCPRCPTLQERIDQLKRENSRLRAENARLKRKNGQADRGDKRDQIWRQGVHEIAQLTWKQQRLIFTMPEIRAVCERLLGMKDGGSTKRYAPKRYR